MAVKVEVMVVVVVAVVVIVVVMHDFINSYLFDELLAQARLLHRGLQTAALVGGGRRAVSGGRRAVGGGRQTVSRGCGRLVVGGWQMVGRCGSWSAIPHPHPHPFPINSPGGTARQTAWQMSAQYVTAPRQPQRLVTR